MTELEELKNHIEALEKRVEASDKKIALLEETLSTLGKFKASKEMGEYIERQQNAIRMADMLNSTVDDTIIDTSNQMNTVSKLQKQQNEIKSQIKSAITQSQVNLIQNNGSSLRYLKYESNDNVVIVSGCTAFDSVDIVIPEYINGKPVVKIEKGAFSNSSIKSIALPKGLNLIDDLAFEDCKNLKNVYNINCNIGYGAFKGCSSLERIIIGDKVKSIGKDAFYGCLLLRQIDFGNGLETIGESAFYKCNMISNINIENTKLKVLSHSCFKGCAVKSIIFPKSLKSIEAEALYIYANKIPLKIVIPEYINEVDLSFISNGMVAFLGMNTLITFLDYTEISTKKNRIVYCLSGSKVQEYCIKEKIPCRPLSEFPTE